MSNKNNLTRTYAAGELIDVRIEKIVPRGLGIGFVEGLTVLTPLTAPGDLVTVEIVEVKKRLAFGEIRELKEAGPRRSAPPCVYFGECGGCDFQQMDYEAQLAAKVGIIRDCFHRIGKIELEKNIAVVPSSDPLNYRSRARWHIDRGAKAFGYFRRDSHEVIDVRHCPILTPGLDKTLRDIRNSSNWDLMWNDREQIEASEGSDGRVAVRGVSETEPGSEVAFAHADIHYNFSAEVFFQANHLIIPDLLEAALGDVEGELAYDLYCGVGLFTLPLARRFKQVTAVEGHPRAVEYAHRNIGQARAHNVRLINDGVGAFLKRRPEARPDLVLLDPPRSGTEKVTIPAIAKLRPRQISYVSCDPSMLARDLRSLMDRGYKIDSITALDLFPQTHHVETVARLSLS